MQKHINDVALLALHKQDWEAAQKLFYQNVIENPSHRTYNNLGYYLWSEGLICKDGKHRNARKLGMQYIIKASKLGISIANCCAIAEAANKNFFYAKDDSLPTIAFALNYLEKVLELEDRPDLRYNYYRFLYLLSPLDETHLIRLRELVMNYVTEESVNFYFSLLCMHSKKDEGLDCILKYSSIIDKSNLLKFYAKMGLYVEGSKVFEAVCDQRCIDDEIVAAVIECSLGASNGDAEKRTIYAVLDKIREESDFYSTSSGVARLDELLCSHKLRAELLNAHNYVPPMISCCCYCGCPIHNTAW